MLSHVPQCLTVILSYTNSHDLVGVARLAGNATLLLQYLGHLSALSIDVSRCFDLEVQAFHPLPLAPQHLPGHGLNVAQHTLSSYPLQAPSTRFRPAWVSRALSSWASTKRSAVTASGFTNQDEFAFSQKGAQHMSELKHRSTSRILAPRLWSSSL